MSLADDKKSVFTTIGAYTSLSKDLQKTANSVVAEAGVYSKLGSKETQTNLFASVNNSHDILSFLLDVLKIVVGTTGLQELIGKLLTSFIPSIEKTIKEVLTKQLIQSNAGDVLPDYFITSGITIPAKLVDVNSIISVDPNSDIGNLLYDNNLYDFNTASYNATTVSGTDVLYSNIKINYDQNTDSFIYKAASGVTGTTIGTFISDFIDGAVLINVKEIITKMLDNLFGSVTSNSNKSNDEIINDLSINNKINSAINNNPDILVNNGDYVNIHNGAQQLISGTTYYDIGCGVLISQLPLSGFTDLVQSISGSTDPNFVGSAITTALTNSFANSGSTTGTTTTAAKNAQTINDGFFSKLIQYLNMELIKVTVISPQARMLLGVTSSFTNGGIPQLSNPLNDIDNYKIYIRCIIKNVLSKLYEFIFTLIAALLMSLIDPVLKKIIQEKINQFSNIIKSLINRKL